MNFRKKSILERLNSIYCKEDAIKADMLIEDMIKKYSKKIVSQSYKMTHKDIILITYADQVIHPGDEPLATLDKFLNEYVKDVINSVHILPFYPYSSDDGFSVIDYKDVSPRMGSWDDIERLSKNFNLMFDGVINHISQYSYWFKSFLENDEKYKNFFVEVEEDIDLSMVVRPRALPLIHEYRDCDEKIRRVWTTFSKDQVDLNYANYKVMVAVIDVLLFYVLKGAKLIRLDAIAFLWKEIGTNCIHLPQTHEAIQLMREVIHKVAPEVVIITETNVPHDENVSYFGSGDDEAQMVYNFALPPLAAHTMLSSNTTKLTKWVQELTLPSDKVCFFNFIASHDGCGVRPVADILSDDEISSIIDNVENNGGFVSYRALPNGSKAPYELNASYIDIVSDKNDSIELKAKKFMLIQALKLAMPGVAGIYFHSLVGSTSDRDGVRRSGVLRSINREKLNYDYLVDELNEDGSLRAIIFSEYKKLLNIRTSEEAFDPYGKFEVFDGEDNLFVLLRYSKDEKSNILTINNFSNLPISYKLPYFINSGAMDLISGNKVDSLEITLQPYQSVWIKYNIR